MSLRKRGSVRGVTIEMGVGKVGMDLVRVAVTTCGDVFSGGNLSPADAFLKAHDNKPDRCRVEKRFPPAPFSKYRCGGCLAAGFSMGKTSFTRLFPWNLTKIV